jgi:hypothetical protein
LSAHVTIAIRVGPELVPEPFSAGDPRIVEALSGVATDGYVDGGLDIVVQGQRLSWADVWDHVDAMLLAWLQALDEIAGGHPTALAVFPDTRVECELSRAGDKGVQIEYEDVDAVVDLQPLRDAIGDAAARLLELAATHSASSPALDKLRERHLAGHRT